MKKLLLATALCLVVSPVLAGGLDGMEEDEYRPAPRKQTQVSSQKSKCNLAVSPYVSVKATGTFVNADLKVKGNGLKEKATLDKTVFGSSVAVGAKVANFRAELEYNHFLDAKERRSNFAAFGGLVDAKLKQNSYFLNAYYDIDLPAAVRPYVGAGVGLARSKGDIPGVLSDTDTTFAWQIGAGASYALTDNWNIDAGYRYMYVGDVKLDNEECSVKIKNVQDHQVYAGIRFTF